MANRNRRISVTEGKALYGNWQSSRQPLISQSFPQDPSDFTFNLSDLQEYLAYVKDQSKKQGIEDPGIRVYFGAFDDEQGNKATVFFAPTTGDESEDDNNYNLDAFDFGTGGWPPRSY
jgi:hypothetical protein